CHKVTELVRRRHQSGGLRCGQARPGAVGRERGRFSVASSPDAGAAVAGITGRGQRATCHRGSVRQGRHFRHIEWRGAPGARARGSVGFASGGVSSVISALLESRYMPIREQAAKLASCVAGENVGRDYLLQGNAKIIKALANALVKEDHENSVREGLLCVLQKLSIRRSAQSAMNDFGLVPYLLAILVDTESASDATVAHASALLMNLCVRSAGRRQCLASDPSRALQVLSDLVEHENVQVKTYVNGTLYSILADHAAREAARAMGMGDMLRCLREVSEKQLVGQIDFVIQQLNSAFRVSAYDLRILYFNYLFFTVDYTALRLSYNFSSNFHSGQIEDATEELGDAASDDDQDADEEVNDEQDLDEVGATFFAIDVDIPGYETGGVSEDEVLEPPRPGEVTGAALLAARYHKNDAGKNVKARAAKSAEKTECGANGEPQMDGMVIRSAQGPFVAVIVHKFRVLCVRGSPNCGYQAAKRAQAAASNSNSDRQRRATQYAIRRKARLERKDPGWQASRDDLGAGRRFVNQPARVRQCDFVSALPDKMQLKILASFYEIVLTDSPPGWLPFVNGLPFRA
ncbi:MAG: hypothetical protein BJ554DRAFT_8075, partial [Olpidium bornovanus]